MTTVVQVKPTEVSLLTVASTLTTPAIHAFVLDTVFAELDADLARECTTQRVAPSKRPATCRVAAFEQTDVQGIFAAMDSPQPGSTVELTFDLVERTSREAHRVVARAMIDHDLTPVNDGRRLDWIGCSAHTQRDMVARLATAFGATPRYV